MITPWDNARTLNGRGQTGERLGRLVEIVSDIPPDINVSLIGEVSMQSRDAVSLVHQRRQD